MLAHPTPAPCRPRQAQTQDACSSPRVHRRVELDRELPWFCPAQVSPVPCHQSCTNTQGQSRGKETGRAVIPNLGRQVYQCPRAATTNDHRLGGLKPQISSLTVQEARSPKSRLTAVLSLKSVEGILCFRFWFLVLQSSVAYGSITPISASVFVWPSSLCACTFLKSTLVFGFKTHSDNPG